MPMKPEDKTSPDEKQGHRKRLRDKFLERGLAGFSDYEVVELLLTLGTPRRDCKPTAKAALKLLGSLSGVLEASSAELARVKGIGPANQFGIRLVKAVADRYLETRITDKPAVRNSKDLFDYLYGTMRGLKKERFTLIFLDTKNKIIKVYPISEGTVSESTVHPREVVAAALEHHAAAVIFAHNHPSGDPSPSPEDIAPHPAAGVRLRRGGHHRPRAHHHRQQPILQLRRPRPDGGHAKGMRRDDPGHLIFPLFLLKRGFSVPDLQPRFSIGISVFFMLDFSIRILAT